MDDLEDGAQNLIRELRERAFDESSVGNLRGWSLTSCHERIGRKLLSIIFLSATTIQIAMEKEGRIDEQPHFSEICKVQVTYIAIATS